MTVYLAPHHDDLLLSLPSRLCAGTAGDLGIVVFSEEDDAMRAVCNRLHAALGLDIVEMGFVEARRRGVSMRGCLRHERRLADVAQDPLVDDVLGALDALLDGNGATAVLAPLLPIHIDHAIVRVAAERLAGTDPAVRLDYYQDQPYAALWPRTLARETARMVPGGSGRQAPPGMLERLLDGLRTVVEQRDLDRIAQALRQEPCEPLWTGRAGHV
ncbi:MAG TPA: hypothetical protein VK943_16120 [Arenibaculum sp.]|nr:hypothetical protein [Arenibaculum sp.]